MDCSPPGSSVQARIVEWVAFSFSGDLPSPGIKPGSPALHADFMYLFTFYRLSYWESQNEKWTWKSLSRVWLFPTPRTATTIHGLLQARILEWVAFPFSRGSSQPRAQTQVSHVAGRFFTTELWGKRGEDKSSLNLEPDYSKYSPDPWPQTPGSLLEMLTLESHTRLLNYSFFLLFTCCFSSWYFLLLCLQFC